MNLVDLWKLKSSIAGSRYFDAKTDLGRAAFDIIMAVAFGLSDQDGATSRQISLTSKEASRSLLTAKVLEADSPYPFQTADMDREGQALLDLTDSIHIGITSILPYLYSWIALRRPPLSHAVRTKEVMMARHIDNAVAKLPLTDEEAQRSAQTALEYLVFRERTIARREGRKPDYHGRYIYDEVSPDFPMLSSRILVRFLCDQSRGFRLRCRKMCQRSHGEFPTRKHAPRKKD
jgi:hypothetical protein